MGNTFKQVTVPIALVVIVAAAWLSSAGDLNPPGGPISPTMKTLAEVEPRIAVSAINTPGDADSLFKITQPGSYYLTGNLTGVSGRIGIEIAAPASGPGVTLDLMGFEVAGVPGSLEGINVTVATTRNVAVRNGVVRAWGAVGVRLNSSTYNQVSDLRVYANGSDGILAGVVATVTRCTVEENAGDGINVSTAGIVTDCSVNSNSGDGIQVASRCLIRNNNVASNTLAGIMVTGSGGRIDDNHCTQGQRGFHITGSDNLVIRNSTQGTTVLAYDIAAGNHQAAIISSPGLNFASTSPWANFSY